MSGLAAVVSFDGPAGLEEIGRLCAAGAYRAGDGVKMWHCGAAALAHLSHRALPESDCVTQPLLAADGDLAIVFDGRLDAREELAARLGGLQPDASLALAACRRWGTAAAEHLLGDFALVAWSRARQTLYCARDIMGIRPLYYHWSPARFVCASDVAQVLAARGVTPAPNEGMLGEYLANSIVDRHETVYRGIYRLPGAHWLELRPGSAPVLRRYWEIDRDLSLRYRTDAEYADHFRALFLAAVRDRLRAAGPVGVYLSGGTDSAAVAAAASAVTGQAARPAAYTLDVGRPEADERQYARRPGAVLRVRVARVPGAATDLGGDRGGARRARPSRRPRGAPVEAVDRGRRRAGDAQRAWRGCRVLRKLLPLRRPAAPRASRRVHAAGPPGRPHTRQ